MLDDLPEQMLAHAHAYYQCAACGGLLQLLAPDPVPPACSPFGGCERAGLPLDKITPEQFSELA